ncbi:hypothetical protein ACHHRT_11160 [Desulfurivibrio sp. D14AmB]|uniref:hypothetical protein n=1 Tax=Desulfurivibrio sp. D14AmB TaxID=3374370 RepID=UPI00376EA7E8
MTALKNKDRGNGKKLAACQREVWDDKHRAVWVKHETLTYEKELVKLQIELLKYQTHIKRQGMRVMILFEGRDAAGKGGTIQRIMQHLNPRGARVVALEQWDNYTVRKFQMLSETNRSLSPWTIIRSNNKKKARINCIKHILSMVDYADKLSAEELTIDPKIVISGIDELRFMEENLMSGNTLPG